MVLFKCKIPIIQDLNLGNKTLDKPIHRLRLRMNSIYLFGDYRLDTANAQLLKYDHDVPLPPKAFAMLAYFIERRGMLVTKDELLDAVWEHRYVTEGVLKSTVQIVRQALGDDAKTPKFLETIHRRGYRFIADVALPTSSAIAIKPPPRLNGAEPTPLVGRDAELEQLYYALAQAWAGTPQLLFVTGEAGIGKTTLIEHFLVVNAAEAVIGRGQCVEQYGQSEPYLPILEALNLLCRQQGDAALAALARTAPDWLAELPWLINDSQPPLPAKDGQPNTQARMLRELGELLEQWSRDFPLLLVLEDLHWSDCATLDALAFLARRKNPGRWLIVASYRPEQALGGNQPLAQIVRDLRVRGLSQEIALPLLSEHAVGDYMRQRCGADNCAPELIAAIYRRSEGLPFFVAQLIENIDRLNGDALQALPEGLQYLLEQQFERLPAEQQALLSAAAIAGVVFSVPLLATLLGLPEMQVESQCETLLRNRHFLGRAKSVHMHDNGGHYAFLHAYYHEYVYRRAPSYAKAELHRQTAYWLERHLHAGGDDTLSELALHFELGSVYDKAVVYLQQAVNLAMRRFAPHEAIQLARRALAILETHALGAEPGYEQQIIRLYTVLIAALQATQGFASNEVPALYERVLRRAEQQNNPVQMSAILWSLGFFYSVQGEVIEARNRGWRRLYQLGESSGEIIATICGNIGLGAIEVIGGNLKVAGAYLQTALNLFDFNQHAGLFNMMALHPLVLCHASRAQAAWLSGFPDQAWQAAQTGLELAAAIKQPFSVGFALWILALCAQMRGDFTEAARICDELLALSHEHGLILLTKLAILLKGWAVLKQGDHENGVQGIYTGLNMIRDTGGKLMQSQMLALCCDACLEAGLNDDAKRLLAIAQSVVAQQRSERYFEAELYRLQGELLLLAADADQEEAAALFRQALATAEAQGANSLALSAAVSLARLLIRQGLPDQARQVLHGIHARFTEGFNTHGLQQAAAILSACA